MRFFRCALPAALVAMIIVAVLPCAETSVFPTTPTVSESLSASVAPSHTQLVWVPYVGLVVSAPPILDRYVAGEYLQVVVNSSGALTTYAWNRTPSGSLGAVMPSVTPQTVIVGWYPTTTAGGTTIVTTVTTQASSSTSGTGTTSATGSGSGMGTELNIPPVSGDFYGGDEFYYTTKQAYGLMATTKVTSPIIQLNTPLGRACFQIGFSASSGVGVLLNAYGSQGYGVMIEGSYLKIVKGVWNTSSNSLAVVDVLREVSIANISNPLIYVKLDVNGNNVVSLVNVVAANNASISYWYKVVFAQSNTYVSNLVIEGTDHVIGSMLIMSGDYLKVTGDQSLMVSINGTDLLGRHVYVNVSDGSAGDCDGAANEVMYCNPFWLWPLKGTLSVNLPTAPLQYNLSLTGAFWTYSVGVGANYSVNMNTSGLAGLTLPFITDFADYRDLIAVFIILLIVLLATEANAPVVGFVAVGAMVFFAVIGWLHIGGAAIGTALVIVGLGAAISRKGNS